MRIRWPRTPPLPMVLALADALPFVERPHAMAVLDDAWTGVANGERRVVVVAGESGAGKTRLATEFARRAHERGAAVLYGSCADTSDRPYGAIREALDGLARSLSPSVRAALLDHAGPALSRLSARFDPGTSGGRGVRAGGVDSERYATASTVDAVLDILTARHPVLLVLDDVHAADPGTADILDHLTRGSGPTSVCILATHRTEASDLTPAARSVLAELRHRPGARRLQLSGLDPDEVRAFVEAATGRPVHLGLHAVVAFLSDQTDGNPLLLTELWRDLVETGRLVRPERRWRLSGPLELPTAPLSVRELVAARLARLPPATRETLEWAAVLARTFELDVLAAAVNAEGAQLLRALEPALDAGMVEAVEPGRWRFTHQLVRRAAYDDQPQSTRRERHLALASALRTVHGTGSLDSVASHLLAALPLGDHDEAIGAAVEASERAFAQLRYADSASQLQAALAAAGDEQPRRGRLLLALAEAMMRAGDVESALAHALGAHHLGVALDDSDLIVSSALAFDEANWRAALHGGRSREVLTTALAHAADERTVVMLEAARARALALTGAGAAARAEARDALSRAHRLGDVEAIRASYTALLFTDWSPDVVPELLDAAHRFATFAAGCANPEWETWALGKVLFGTVVTGRLDETRAVLRTFSTLGRELNQPLFRVLGHQVTALLAAGEGRYDDAEAAAREADSLGRFLSARDASGGFGVQMFGIRRDQGRLEEARPVVEAVAALGDGAPVWRPALALLYAELGMRADASALVESLVAASLTGIPDDSMRPAALAYLADAACLAGVTSAAEPLYRALEPMGGLVVQAGSFLAAYGATDRFLGALAALGGDERRAEHHFQAALRLEAPTAMTAWTSRTQLAYGNLLVAAEPQRAAAFLSAAAEAAERIGLVPVATAARARLAEVPHSRRAPTADGHGFSPRELTVLDQLVLGRTNRQIGLALGISHHTAANHVRAILLKAGFRNRTEAASWAARRGQGVAGDLR